MNVRVTVLVFSGRSNPSWETTGNVASKIIGYWENLSSITGVRLPAPRLGYQGCQIEWKPAEYVILYDGYGYLFKNGKQVEQKRDSDRKTERLILSTAPSQYADLIRQVIRF